MTKTWGLRHEDMHAQSLSCVQLFATPWTAACQAPLSLVFSRQEYWSGLPFPSPGDPPTPGIEPTSPVAPALAGGFFITEPPKGGNSCFMTFVDCTLCPQSYLFS